MLINGGFENGSLLGWQTLCSSSCGSWPGALSSTNPPCHTGSHCFMDGCKGDYDFLRQTFHVVMGHIYRLNFWVNVSQNQDIFVKIF